MRHFINLGLVSSIVSSSLLTISVTASATDTRRPTHSRAQQRLERIIDEANNDSAFRSFMYHYESGMIRKGKDKAFYQLIETNASVSDVRRQVETALTSNAGLVEVALMLESIYASHDNNPNNPELLVLQDCARRLLFPPQQVRESVLLRKQGSVNAFTNVYDRIRVVIYQDLLERLAAGRATPEDLDTLRAVFSHELTHIKFRHIVSSVVLQTMYQTVRDAMAPESSATTAPNPEVVDALRHTMGLERASHDVGLFEVNLVLQIVDRTARAALQQRRAVEYATILNQVRKDMGQPELFAINGDTITLIAGEATRLTSLVANARALRGLNATATNSDAVDAGMAEHLRALTFDQEASADRGAVIVAGPEATTRTMAILAGGREESPELMLNQARLILERANALRIQVEELGIGGDHPPTSLRVAAAEQWSHSRQYRVLTNPTMHAADLYFKMRMLRTAQHGVVVSDEMGLITTIGLSFNDQALDNYSRRLSDYLISEVVADVQRGDARKMMDLRDYLDMIIAENQGRPLNGTGDFAPMLAELRNHLSAIENNAVAAASLVELNARVQMLPPNAISPLELAQAQHEAERRAQATQRRATTRAVTRAANTAAAAMTCPAILGGGH